MPFQLQVFEGKAYRPLALVRDADRNVLLRVVRHERDARSWRIVDMDRAKALPLKPAYRVPRRRSPLDSIEPRYQAQEAARRIHRRLETEDQVTVHVYPYRRRHCHSDQFRCWLAQYLTGAPVGWNADEYRGSRAEAKLADVGVTFAEITLEDHFTVEETTS